MIDIANKITLLRKEKGLSQTELANMVGCSREIISKYEKDSVMPSIEIAKKIADAFGVTLDYLVGEGQNSKLDKKNLKRLHDIETLDAEDRKHLYEIIDAYLRDRKTKKAYA